MVIYTRTGDKGSASTLSGERRPKTDEVFEAGGTVDELSAHLGLVRAVLSADIPGGARVAVLLRSVQEDAVSIGAYISSGDSSLLDRLVHLPGRMEAVIDAVVRTHPIDGFVLAGENELEARFQVARTVCRRAERRFHALGERTDPRAAAWLNRLSDLLFALALWARAPDDLPA